MLGWLIDFIAWLELCLVGDILDEQLKKKIIIFVFIAVFILTVSFFGVLLFMKKNEQSTSYMPSSGSIQE